MGIDMTSMQNRAKAGTLATSTATGGSGGPAVPEGTFGCVIKAAKMDASQKGEPQLVVDFAVKAVAEARGLEEGETEDAVRGRDFRAYFLANAAVEADTKWAERLLGDVVVIAKASGINPDKIFVDSDGDAAKTTREVFLNFAQIAQRRITKGEELGIVQVERVRQAKNPKYFNHAFSVPGGAEASAPAKKSTATEGL
jgi:hypothetical protein